MNARLTKEEIEKIVEEFSESPSECLREIASDISTKSLVGVDDEDGEKHCERMMEVYSSLSHAIESAMTETLSKMRFNNKF